MLHPLEAGTIRILKSDGSTAGTGFLVSKRLAVTCAHVVESANAKTGTEIRFEFHAKSPAREEKQIGAALVLEKGWSKENDIAILELKETAPDWIKPLILKGSGGIEGSKFLGLGYPNDGPSQIRWADGSIRGRVEVVGFVDPVFQIGGELIDQGFSGCAIVEQASRRVIGMLTAYQDLARPTSAPKVRIGYIIPTESIWMAYPEIRNETEQRKPYAPLLDGIDQLPYDYARLIQKFLTDYLGTPELPEPFGGREDLFKILDEWLESASQRLLLAAPAGRGKSALLVRWIDSLIARDDLVIAFVPISVRYRTNLASASFASLAARLAFLHEDPVPTNIETSTEIYRDLANQYFSNPLPNNKTMLVVLDGLDEAADWEAAVDLVPASLPPDVRVVVSARFLSGDTNSKSWLKRLGWHRKGMATSIELAPLSLEGVADVLRRMGFPLDALSKRVNIVTELYRLSEGDPLLVNLYVEDLWDRGEAAARLEPENLREIKPGIEGYFEKWWDDQKELWGGNALNREKNTKLVFNLLCSAMGPLTGDDFLSLSKEDEIDTYIIEESVRTLKRFVIGIPNDRKDEIGYVLSHPKLRDYFWDKLSHREQSNLENRFLTWGEEILRGMIEEKINPKDRNIVPFYIIQYYSEHLHRAKQPIAKYLPLTHHQEWAQAWFTLEGTYGGYLKDVYRIWEICKELDRKAIKEIEKAPYFGEQIRCALIAASIHSLAGNIPSELIVILKRNGIWTLPQIWIYVRNMPTSGQQAKMISALLAHLTDDELSGALEAMCAIQDDEVRAHALIELAERLPEANHKALETAESTRDENKRAAVLTALAEHLPEAELGKLLKMACTIQDEPERAAVLTALAKRLPEAELGKLLQEARAIQGENARVRVLAALVERLPEVSSEALEAAHAIQDVLTHTYILENLAERLPEAELSKVLQEARAIHPEWMRASIMSALVKRLPEAELGKLLQEARAIQDENARARVLAALVERLPEVSSEALKAARTIQDDLGRANVMSDLAKRLPDAELGKFLDEARVFRVEWMRANDISSILAKRLPETELGKLLQEARAIQDENARARVLIELAERLPEAELNILLEAARAIQDENARARVLIELAERLPEAELSILLEVAHAIHDDKARAYVLIALTDRLPEVSSHALKAARAVQDDRARAYVLIALTDRLPEVSSHALKAARAIQDDEVRARVLIELADRLPDVSSEALEATRVIRDNEERTRVLITLSKHLPEVKNEALEMVRAIEDEGKRIRILTALVVDWPEVGIEALEAVRKSKSEWTRCNALKSLAKHLPETALEQLLEVAGTIELSSGRERVDVLSILAQRWSEVSTEALETARAIQDETFRFDAFSYLAERLPKAELGKLLEEVHAFQIEWRRAYIMSVLIKRLPEAKLGKFLEEARAIQGEEERGQVLTALAERLPERELKQILEAARAIQNKEFQIPILGALAKRGMDTNNEILEAAWAIKNEWWRVNVLRTLAENLPEGGLGHVLEAARTLINSLDKRYLADILSSLAVRMPEVMNEALDVVGKIIDEDDLTDYLSYLIEYLPDGLLEKALEIASRIDNTRGDRGYVLAALVHPLVKLPINELYQLLEITLPIFSHRRRADLFKDISSLFPAFLHISEENLTREVYEAVQDVNKWWR